MGGYAFPDLSGISAETRAKVEKAREEMDSEFRGDNAAPRILGAGDVMAAFRIEIMFGQNRTVRGPNSCLIQLHESGKHFHGGGDAVMYVCLDGRKLTASTADLILLGLAKEKDRFAWVGGCGGIIPSNNVNNGMALCPKCKKLINATHAAHLLPLLGITSRRLAEVLEMLFHRLDDNADLYCKFFKDDIRYLSMQKAYGEEKARRLRGGHLYPLDRLIKDISAGAGLQDRIYAFLTS